MLITYVQVNRYAKYMKQVLNFYEIIQEKEKEVDKSKKGNGL